MSRLSEFGDWDAIEQARLVRDGDVTPLELVEEAIARIEELNPRLNAVVHPMFERARSRAESPTAGPLSGVPFLLKDLISTVEGAPTRGGSRFSSPAPCTHDSEFVRRLEASGLIIAGKTNTPEFGLLPVTEPELFGATRNPWDTSRTPGGSSGGTAAAVASRMVAVGSGGDGGGSIRIPASCCGLFGLKPTRARTPCGPDGSEWWFGFAQEHVLSRTVRDSAILLDVTSGPELGAPYGVPGETPDFLGSLDQSPRTLRIAIAKDTVMPGELHPDCRAAGEDARKVLEELGHEVEVISLGCDTMKNSRAFVTGMYGCLSADIQDLERALGRTATAQSVETRTWLLHLMALRTKAADFVLAIRHLQSETRRLARLLEPYDLLMSPTLGTPPLKLGELGPGRIMAVLEPLVAKANASRFLHVSGAPEEIAKEAFAFIPNTAYANFSGCPSMSVPLHWNDAGLPIGTMFTAKFGDEVTLFQLGRQLEEARPWIQRTPGVVA